MTQPINTKPVNTTVVNNKVSISQLLPGVSVSMHALPYAGYDVVVTSPAGDEPEELYSGLRAIGFNPRNGAAQPNGDGGGLKQSFGRHGTGLLGGWTRPEEEQYTADIRRTLRRFGFALVPQIPRPRSSTV